MSKKPEHRKLINRNIEFSPDEMIEEGLSLIARGMFRMADENIGNDPRGAYDAGMGLVSVIRNMAFDFNRKSQK